MKYSALSKFFISIFILILPFSTACNREEPIDVVKEKFEHSTAADMVRELEEPIVQMLSRKSVTREELAEIEKEFDDVFQLYSQSILTVFFDGADWENKELTTLDLIQKHFYPTIYHQDVEITEAYIEKILDDDPHPLLDRERLHIHMKYVGDDPLLQDFQRVYIFSKNDRDEWFLNGLSGILNVAEGEKFHPAYLELKKSDEYNLQK